MLNMDNYLQMKIWLIQTNWWKLSRCSACYGSSGHFDRSGCWKIRKV